MKDKLRGLAEWMRDVNGHCADALTKILDAEGDGGAAATVGQPPEREELISASLAIGGWLAAALDDPAVCAEMKRDINRWFDAAMPSAQAHPARSGVVSDEMVQKAIVAAESYSSATRIGWEAMRSAIEAAIQGERHER